MVGTPLNLFLVCELKYRHLWYRHPGIAPARTNEKHPYRIFKALFLSPDLDMVFVSFLTRLFFFFFVR